jgi:DNA anti-recombination protein RmuC
MPDSVPHGTGGARLDPTERTTEGLHREIEHLRELLQEKIDAVNARIDSQKELTEAQFKASTENVATAFTAAKEAVSKQEADTTKQLDRLQDIIRTVEGALAQRFEDLKGRIDRGEGKGAGVSSASAAMLAIAGVLIALGSVAASFYLGSK